MIYVIDLLEEIRNGYGRNLDVVNLTKDRLIDYINSALYELYKREFLITDSYITITLTSGQTEYYLGEDVKEIVGVEQIVLDRNYPIYWSIDDINADCYFPEPQKMIVNNPLDNVLLKINIKKFIPKINKDVFLDYVVLYKSDTDIVEKIKINTKLDLLKILNSDFNTNIISLETQLLTEVIYFNESSINEFYEKLVNYANQSIVNMNNIGNRCIKFKTIEVKNFEMNIPEWIYQIVWSGLDVDYDKNEIKFLLKEDREIIIRFDECDCYNPDYDWNKVLINSPSYLNNFYTALLRENKIQEAEEYSKLYEIAVNYQQLIQQRDYSETVKREAEMSMQLGAYNNTIDILSEYKEFILLFVANKLALSFNSNANEYQTMYFKAYMNELDELDRLGFKKEIDYVRPVRIQI